MLTTSGTYPWSFVTQIFHNGQPSHDGDRKTFEVMTFVLLLLVIVLSVLLRYTDSDYPFVIFKLFLVVVHYISASKNRSDKRGLITREVS
jgi:hypothetical protein